MVRSVLAEEKSLDYLNALAQPESYSIGVILGQSVGNRDFVIHLARTPSPASKDVKEEGSDSESSPAENEDQPIIKTMKDINDNWVAEHSKHVTRMLPGGVWVLGIFIVGPTDAVSDSTWMSRIKSILSKVTKSLATNPHLHGNGPNAEKLILCFNSISKKFECKSIDVVGVPSHVEWKFQANPTRWHQLDCNYNFDQIFPIGTQLMAQSLKKHLQDILEKVSSNVKTSVCMIDGEVKSSSDPLDTVSKKKKGKSAVKEKENETKIFQVNLYVPSDMDVAADTEMEVVECGGELNFQGILASRVYLHQKATVEEAESAVKQDIVRSLAARFEMHWDSLIDEENGSPEESSTVHEPPRRVLVSLPHCRVTMSDYLFPGEGPIESLHSLQELLDLKVTEADIQKEVEGPPDASDFYKDDKQLENDPEDSLPVVRNVRKVRLYSSFGLAILALLISFIVHYYISFSGSKN